MGHKILIGPNISKGFRNDVTAFNIDNDAFLKLINAYQWRGRVKRKRGTSLLGRLKRQIVTQSIGNSGASDWTFNLFSFLSPSITTTEPNVTIVPGTVDIFFTPNTITGNIIAGPFSPESEGYTLAADCEVFTNTITGLSTGSEVTISGVNVVAGTGPNEINGGPYLIEVIPANTSFKIGIDSQSWGRWASGGSWVSPSGSIIFKDQGDGTLTSTTPGNSGVINYSTGVVTLIHTSPGVAVNANFEYYPNLPVMGIE